MAASWLHRGRRRREDCVEATLPPAPLQESARAARRHRRHSRRRRPEAVSSVFGGIPCQPVARAGGARGIDDDRIADTTDALPAAALAIGADSADAENHADLVTINNGAVLDRLNANFGTAFLLADVSFVMRCRQRA